MFEIYMIAVVRACLSYSSSDEGEEEVASLPFNLSIIKH